MVGDPIRFYFDFSSPYGYFASFMVDGMAANFERSVVWKPMMLGAAMKETGNTPLAGQPLKGDYCKLDWERMGKMMDVPWTLPDPFPIATLAAARAFYWLDDRDPDLAKRFAVAAFKTYFGDGRDITPPDVIAEVAEPLGVDKDELLAAVQDPAVKERLKAETSAAIEAGVFGSPYIVVDGEPFWGADRFWMIKRKLAAQAG